MKKIFWMIQVAALSASMQAFALVGGPFDNGDYSILLDRNGYYQASFTYQNGNGYAIWTSDNLMGTSSTGNTTSINYGTGSLITAGTGAALSDHNANRSVLYYKGVTYVGSAYGAADFDGDTIQGNVNAYSEFTISTTATNTQQNLLTQSSVSTATLDQVVTNGRSYVANIGWTAEITDSTPILTFSGTGELSIIAPNGRETLAGLAYGGYSGLIDSINQSVSNLFSGGDVSLTNIDIYGSAQDAIDSALAGLEPYLTGTGPSNSYAESEVQPVDVEGYRRYF